MSERHSILLTMFQGSRESSFGVRMDGTFSMLWIPFSESNRDFADFEILSVFIGKVGRVEEQLK